MHIVLWKESLNVSKDKSVYNHSLQTFTYNDEFLQ